jgi:hypothetical protein
MCRGKFLSTPSSVNDPNPAVFREQAPLFSFQLAFPPRFGKCGAKEFSHSLERLRDDLMEYPREFEEKMLK